MGTSGLHRRAGARRGGWCRRKEGFLDAVRDSGAGTDRVPYAEGKFSMDSGYEQTKLLLSANPEIDSIFCATDSIAIGAVAYLREIGKTGPGGDSDCRDWRFRHSTGMCAKADHGPLLL